MTDSRERARPAPPPRLADDAHKGDAGRVLCVCGSQTMPGAAVLTVRAAMRAGAGLVTLACLDSSLLSIIPLAAPEVILADLASARGDERWAELLAAGRSHARVAGPGLGANARTLSVVKRLLAAAEATALVLDADALNVLVPEPQSLRAYGGPLVITPHPGEAQRLLRREIPRDDEGRAQCARELSLATGAICVLKGRASVIADGDRVEVNSTGNSGMATAGAGDVLAGILAAYLALCGTGAHPEWQPFDAVRAAVHVHGLAGDLAAAVIGPRGLIASDLIDYLPAAQRAMQPDLPAAASS